MTVIDVSLSVEVSSVVIVARICGRHEGVRNSIVMAARSSESQHYVNAKGQKQSQLSSKRMSFSVYRAGGCMDPIKSPDTLENRYILHLPEIEP
jgi:hypothetical protein